MTTIKDIAEKTGVSVATVSHVVNKTRYVSPELTKKVEEAIQALDSVPNFMLKRQKREAEVTKLFVVYVTDFGNTFQRMIVEELRNLTQDKGITLFPIVYDDLEKKSDEVFERLAGKIEGQIVLYEKKKIPQLKVRFSKVPTIFIGSEQIETTEYTTISSETKQGSYLATNHLIKNGHRKIALLHVFGNETGYLVSGYQQAFVDNGMKVEDNYLLDEQITQEKLEQTLKEWFLETTPPTAMIVDTSVLLQVIDFFNRQDIKHPKDISIIATDDESWFSYFSPPITSIEHDIRGISRQALAYLEQSSELVQSLVPAKLQIRASAGGIGRGPFGEKAAPISALALTEGEKRRIASKQQTAVISFHYTGASWMDLHEKGMREVFAELNIAIIGIADAHFQPDLQNKQLNSFLALEPDLFIAIPTDNKKTSKMFKKIANSDAKLILITNVPEGLTPDDYETVVSVNEHYHGRLAASGLGDNLRAAGKKHIGIVYHDSDFYATNQRDLAARQILLEEYGDLTIVGETSFQEVTDVYENTLSLMRNHPEIEGLYISWDEPTKEVLRALRELGREDIVIGTADLDFPLAMNMAENGSVKSISAQQPYEQGRAIALAAAKALLEQEVPSFIGIEPIKVTRKNLLKSWKDIFKEAPSGELVERLKLSDDIN